jgi:hypothetical protein
MTAENQQSAVRRSRADFVRVLEAAMMARNAAPRVRASGCGRAYVAVRGISKAERPAFMAAASAVGFVFMRKAYGTAGDVIYVGYDNADGRALGQAEAIAASLIENGISAYTDPVED